jgi:hypothetical protein
LFDAPTHQGGRLILKGEDLGGAVQKVRGCREYEWAWLLHPERLGFFLKLRSSGTQPKTAWRNKAAN